MLLKITVITVIRLCLIVQQQMILNFWEIKAQIKVTFSATFNRKLLQYNKLNLLIGMLISYFLSDIAPAWQRVGDHDAINTVGF